jgi:hypothetical protein
MGNKQAVGGEQGCGVTPQPGMMKQASGDDE